MFYEGLDPILIRMTAYYRRPDHRQLAAARTVVEQTIGAGWAAPAGSEHPADNLER